MAKINVSVLASKGVNGFVAVGLLGLLLMIQKNEGFQFTVGGKSGWTVPSDSSPLYNQWAERTRFQIGDSLLFVYPQSSDSVLHVTKEDYDSCNTSSFIEQYTDGHTVFTFNQSGPYYFISGNRDNCLKNERLVVVVLADRTKKAAAAPASPPSPPSPSPTPAAAQHPSSPPPSPAIEFIPTPAPSAESPPKNGAAALNFDATLFGGLLGAFAVSSIVLSF